MSDYIDGVHVTEFLDDSLEPHFPSPGGRDKKRAANPYLRNKRPSKKMVPAAAVVSVPPAAQVDSDEGDEEDDDSLDGVVEVSAVTPGDTTPAVAHVANVARAASSVPLAAHNQPGFHRPTPRAARTLFETTDPTVNALVVAGPQGHADNNPNNNAIVPAGNNHNQRTITAILPGDWRFTIHNMNQSDKFGKLFSTIARKPEAWCKGLEILDVVTTSYASRALEALDDSDDEGAFEIHGMEGVATHMVTSMSPLVKRVLYYANARNYAILPNILNSPEWKALPEWTTHRGWVLLRDWFVVLQGFVLGFCQRQYTTEARGFIMPVASEIHNTTLQDQVYEWTQTLIQEWL